MNVYFADTSAFAKRYLPETGSAWVQGWIEAQTGNITVISALGTVEFVSLLARRLREGAVSENDFHKLRRDFLFHAYRQYKMITLTVNILTEARELVAKHPLRALDAIQLACALTATRAMGIKPVFVSADTKLLDAARIEGFLTDNPNAHVE